VKKGIKTLPCLRPDDSPGNEAKRDNIKKKKRKTRSNEKIGHTKGLKGSGCHLSVPFLLALSILAIVIKDLCTA